MNKKTTKQTKRLIPVINVNQKGQSVPDGFWTYTDENGMSRYTPAYMHICDIAAQYDNAAIRDGRKYSDNTIELVQQRLIDFGYENVPNIGSLKTYLNKHAEGIRTKVKGSTSVGHAWTESKIAQREKIYQAIIKK